MPRPRVPVNLTAAVHQPGQADGADADRHRDVLTTSTVRSER